MEVLKMIGFNKESEGLYRKIHLGFEIYLSIDESGRVEVMIFRDERNFKSREYENIEDFLEKEDFTW